MTVFIIPCGSKKKTVACEAQELYDGLYFKSNLEYAKRKTSRVFILSAKYGFVRLNQIIEPYNLHMKNSTITVEHLRRQATVLGIISESPFVLGGKNYVRMCERVFPAIRRVLPKGLGMGEQISLLRRQ